MDMVVLSTALTALLANIALGGGVFEHGLIDRAWPRKPEIIQPGKGGISRARFWIPAHSAFEIVLLVTLYLGWANDGVRKALLLALVAHVTLRLWSAFDMIPKAIAFEKAETVDEAAARDWTRRSLMRFPLALLTSFAALTAFGAACGLSLG
ncbi:hypothetical protein LJR090_005179 [Bosea sp. LjRoot90]|uniref:hypothetical protein n=1 Tax=Bosea sp. LjRoot90 TaxID=3342342 RepID=UPI003ECED70E